MLKSYRVTENIIQYATEYLHVLLVKYLNILFIFFSIIIARVFKSVLDVPIYENNHGN